MIKAVIIIILKFDSRLNIDPGSCKNKNGYYHSFKIILRGQTRARHGSWVGLTIEPSQHKNKNGYYHSFKT